MKNLKKIISLIIISIIILGCSPQQRLNRILKNNPSLRLNTSDTLKFTDTILISSKVHDTTTIFQRFDTTVIINTEKIYAKYVFDTITKEIYHHIECKNDTVYYYKEIPYKVDKIIYQEKDSVKHYFVIGAIILGLFLLLIFIKQIKDIFK